MHKFSTASPKSSVVLCAPPARPASAGAPGLLNVPVGVSRWLTRTECVAHLYQCGFGFAIRTVRASHRLAPTSLRDKNLCIIRASVSPSLWGLWPNFRLFALPFTRLKTDNLFFKTTSYVMGKDCVQRPDRTLTRGGFPLISYGCAGVSSSRFLSDRRLETSCRTAASLCKASLPSVTGTGRCG